MAGDLAVAIVGFSEAGQAFAGGLKRAGARVRVFDLRLTDERAGPALQRTAAEIGVETAGSAAEAVAGAGIVLSLVTAAAATPVARDVAGTVETGQLFFDLNSISPGEKRAGAALIEEAGGRYVEGAIMSPVAAKGHATAILAAGAAAEEVAGLLNPLGMAVEVAGATIGAASATKMCRSVILKGIEALMVESLVAARRWGVEGAVVDSIEATFAGVDWRDRAGYAMGRVVQHGRRRAAEMREAAEAVRAAGLDPLMAEATAARQDWVADLDVSEARVDRDYRALADLLIVAARLDEDGGPGGG